MEKESIKKSRGGGTEKVGIQPVSGGVYFGNHCLARSQLQRISWNRGRMENSVDLRELVKPDSDVIIYVKREDLPPDLMFYFKVTRGFKEELATYCEYVAFCSYLEKKLPDGSHGLDRGFTIGFEQADDHQVEKANGIITPEEQNFAEIFGEEIISHLERTIFINLFDQENTSLFGPALFPPLVHELGHLRNNLELKDGGFRLTDVSKVSKEFYAYAYERQAALELRKFLFSLLQSKKRGIAENNFINLMSQTIKKLGFSPTPRSTLDSIKSIYKALVDIWLPTTNSYLQQYYSQMVQEGKIVYSLSPNKNFGLLAPDEPLRVHLK